jgi:hypothetical protein
MRKSQKRRKDFPYYKIQVYNETVKSWKDIQKAFKTVKTAEGYIAEKVAPQTTRVMVVDREGRHVLKS